MRQLLPGLAFLVAAGCSGSGSKPHESAEPTSATGEFAEEDRFVPTYGKADLERALEKERGAEATAERIVGDLEASADASAADQLRTAAADLAVRRRFIESLESCQSTGVHCPPRLDDPPWSFDPDASMKPPVTAELRFDAESWRKLAAELFGRACACRTVACIDSVGPAIDQLELRPMPDVQGDEVASESITRARECLFRLRGKRHADRAVRVDVEP